MPGNGEAEAADSGRMPPHAAHSLTHHPLRKASMCKSTCHAASPCTRCANLNKKQTAEDSLPVCIRTLRRHSMTLLRCRLLRRRILFAAEPNSTPANTPVRVAGLVLIRQLPASAVETAFIPRSRRRDLHGSGTSKLWLYQCACGQPLRPLPAILNGNAGC